MFKKLLMAVVLSLAMFCSLFAQENSNQKFVGTWKGTMEIQGQAYTVIFNFAEKEGKLTGTGESPEQGGGIVAFENILVNGDKIQLEVVALRGGFEGAYKKDKNAIDGSFIMGEEAFPLCLTKEMKVQEAKEEKKFTSIWEGALDVQGKTLRLVLKFYSNEDGALCAMIDSPDQGVSNVPADGVTLTDEVITFNMPSVGAVYSGKIDKATLTAKGTFTQRGYEFPLDLKKQNN